MEWDIGRITTKRASLTPNKTAFIYEGSPVNYRELNDNVNRIAHCLKDMGLKKGDRISVLLLNCPEFLEVYFAAAKLGAIFVPLNFRLAGPEVEYQLINSGTDLFVFHDVFTEMVDSIRSRIEVGKDRFVFVKSLSPKAPACPQWASDYGNVIKDYSSNEPKPDKPIDMDDPLAIIYTSGVTGAPKGAVVSHHQTYFKNIQIMMYMDMGSEDILLAQLPLFHSGGLFAVATPVLWRGATLLLRHGFDPAQFAEDLERYKATIVFALTTMWRFILQTGKLDEIDVSSVRVVGGGGERTPFSLLDALAKRGLRLQQGFGQTENSAMMMLPKEDIERKKGSIGLPGFCTEVWIADEQWNEVPPGEVGRIVCRGPTRMTGYWNMPEKTAEAIVDGVLDTGDLGYKDEEGYFYIVDRAKDMYRTGGENVYPAEVEKVLADHPGIENVAIIGIPDDKWGETGKAFVILDEGEKLTLEEIHEYLTGKVARYKFPMHVEFLKELPMTASGKIKKIELKEKEGKIF